MMKGPAKRFVDHEGEAYDTRPTRDAGPDATPTPADSDTTRDVGILGLWRYASFGERLATASGVVLSACCACGVIAAVALYGELTALFVSRHNAHASTGHARILTLFGGGRHLPAGNRSLHMDALLEDSVAFAWASAAVMCVQWATAAAAVRLAAGAASATATRLRRRLLAHALSQELAYYDTNSKVNVAAALAEDVEALRAGAGEHTVMTTYLLGSVAAGVALALAYGWQLALVGLAVVPLAIAVAVTVAKYQTRCAAEEVSCYGAAGRVVEQALANIRTVRAFAGEQIEVQSYLRALSPARGVAARRGLAAGAGAGLGWLLTYTINAVVFAYGAALCAWDMHLPPEQQTYHPGVMVTVLFCTFMAAQNIAMCLPHLEVLSSARGAATSLYALLDRQTQISAPPGGGVRPDAFRGDITFDNLYFNYPSRPDVKVLRGLTLRVKAGETVALVGGSGCGKSTLLQLLQRLYEPDSGQLAVDGHRLQDLHIGHYRRSIGVVGQEPVLFSGSVRDNIALGVEHASHEDIVAAAKTAHAHQFISKLPQGYDTMLGERGALLSGGQKQRVAIARAVLRRPAVLLLDEPTSALDPGAERRVQAALDAAAEGRTTIVVSHRLSTIASASRIVFVEQGAVLEQGSHRELVRLRGAYWRLLQADMAHRSVPSPVPAAASEDDDEVVVRGEGPEADAEGHFQRASTRQSRTRASVCRASVLRGSQRLGPVALAAPAGADTTYEQQEESPDAEEAEAEAEEPVPAVSSWSLLQLNAPEWALLLGGGVASLLMGATMPVFALLFSKLYGMFALSDAAEVLRRSQVYAGAFGAVALLCGAATFLQAWLFSAAGARLTHRLREHTFANFLRQEQGWFDSPRNSVGALCARLATDCKAVQGATGTRLGTVLQAASTMLLGVALALPYSWDMTLVSLLSVPCVIGAIYLEGVVSRRGEALQRRALEHASRLATEATLNLATVQSLGVESTILSRYGAALRVAGARSRGAARARGPVYGLCLCAPTLGYAVSLAYGGYLVARHDLPYEYAILVSEALIYGAWMLAEALSFAPSFAAARRSGARIVLALRREPSIRSELADAHEPTAESESGAVEYSNISFRYPTRPGREVLRGLSLRLPPGRTLALVGDSGCGKSTLGHLLMRTYDPQEGTVRLSGLDVRRAAPLHWVRAQLGAVSQEPALFARSLRDNIAYGDSARRVHMDEIVAAAKQANIHNFIAALPMGYDTVLCGGGAQLSGGQKQRVAIARALLRRPAVLLLDEATSALDAASEKAVQSALVAASAGRTTLVIAHRLATVRHAHQIALLKDGVVAELGTHEELVARRGLYWDLLQQQAPHSDTEHTDTDTGHTDTGHTDTGHMDTDHTDIVHSDS